jgi:hypothetical protein
VLIVVHHLGPKQYKIATPNENTHLFNKLYIGFGRCIVYNQYAQPSRGTTRQLTSGYDLRLSGDTLVAQLPYFGRAFSAPIDMRGGGIEFTTTDYGYTLEAKRNGRWNITIDPKDAKDVRQMSLSVSENGYASLQVLSTNRDPITFNGVVVQRVQRR